MMITMVSLVSMRRLLVCAPLVLLLAACGSDDELVDEVEKPARPVEEIYNEGMQYLSENSSKKAVESFEEVERQYPYSEWAVRAQVMAAYAHYKGHRYDDAMTGIDRFLQMHPSNERAPYAFYLKALCMYEQISDVGRDQKMTQLAMGALREVMNRYPDTEYARDARIKLDLTYDHLAGKEMEVGRYYLTRGDNLAAVNRFKTVVEKYQTTSHTPEALLRLTEIYLRLGVREEAQKYTAVLGHNFPGSLWYREAFALLEPQKAKQFPTPEAQKSIWSKWLPL
jgi:outer membrane protein assembly factor BamD